MQNGKEQIIHKGIRMGQKEGTSDERKKELEEKNKQYWDQIYQISPIYYMFYRIKDKTDTFIRSAEGLERKSQEERTVTGKSAVGNEDLLNEFTYRVLSDAILEYHNSNPKKEISENFPKFKVFIDGVYCQNR